MAPTYNIHVWYHGGNCADGIGAKLAAYLKFGKDATYTAVNYHEPMPVVEHGSHVYILDFSYPKEQLRALLDSGTASILVVLDHHKTAQEDLAGEWYATFDMNKSGAVLAWEFFHRGKPVPELLDLIQDRDLWKFHRATSRPVHTGILLALERGQGRDDVAVLEPHLYDASQLAKTGAGALMYQQMLVKRVVDKRHFCVWEFEGHRCAVVNIISDLASETGSAVCKAFKEEIDYCINYVVCADGMAALSIRSKGEFDCSGLAIKLAKEYGNGGGGGHKNAAGCAVNLTWVKEVHDNKKVENE